MKFVNKNYLFLLTFLTVWSAFFFLMPDFVAYPVAGFSGLVYAAAHFLLLCVPIALMWYLLTVNRYVMLIAAPLLLLTGGALGFYGYFFRATFTPTLLDAALSNDLRSSLDVISWQLIVFLMLQLMVAIFAIKYRFKKVRIKRPVIHAVVAILLLILLPMAHPRIADTFNQHYPMNLVHNSAEYLDLQKSKGPRLSPDPHFSHKNKDSLIVVFILGETLRAENLSINGYHRETTPLLKRRKNVVSLPFVFTQHLHTNASVPHILTRADSANVDRAATEESFVSLFKKAGFRSSWISNQEASASFAPFMREADTLIYANADKIFYRYDSWLDEDMLPYYRARLNQASAQLFVLHSIGSHWYYNNHSSKKFEKFKPITQSKILTQNTPEEIINSYDNTVLYTDGFIDQVISSLTKKNAIVIYLSDHGEALGEDGNWLHAGTGNGIKNPAALVWYSDLYGKKYPERVRALRQNARRRYMTDFLFHSILGAAGIESTAIEPSLNIFRP